MESKVVKRRYYINETTGTVKICQIQLDGMAFYKAPYKYYVKGTTLRLLCNMNKEDLTAKNHNGWIGCDTRNQAKRLIARNRKNILKI